MRDLTFHPSPSPVYSIVIGKTGSHCCAIVVSEVIRTIVEVVSVFSFVGVGRRLPGEARVSPGNKIIDPGQQCKSEGETDQKRAED
jgi:hypothetical protein